MLTKYNYTFICANRINNIIFNKLDDEFLFDFGEQ